MEPNLRCYVVPSYGISIFEFHLWCRAYPRVRRVRKVPAGEMGQRVGGPNWRVGVPYWRAGP